MNRYRVVEKVLKEEFAKPYDFGDPQRSDCFFMGLAMIDALTESSFCEKYAGTYSDLLGAQKALRKLKHKSLATFFASILDKESVGGAQAKLGDLAILKLPDGAEHVAICVGSRFATKTPKGRQDYGLSEVIAAFNIG